MRSLIVLRSYHHKNTEKIAKVIAEVIDAKIMTPNEVVPGDLQQYDLVGFGSGIYGGKNHSDLLDLADGLPAANGGRAFIFSTSSEIMVGREGDAALRKYVAEIHSPLKEKLQSKGYVMIGDFSCKGHNTNSFLRFLGGLNKGRPDSEDLKRAEDFAYCLIERL